jgi:hypothetical protein
MTQGYCMKCREKIEIENINETKTKRGVPMIKGNCPICKTKVCKIGGK